MAAEERAHEPRDLWRVTVRRVTELAALRAGGLAVHLVEAVDALLHLVADGDDASFAAGFEAAYDDAVVAHVVDFVRVKHNQEFDLG